MTSHIDTIASGTYTTLAAALGYKSVPLVADTTGIVMPEWIEMMMGPFGALIGLIVALWWMTQRLNRAEKRFEERDKEQQVNREKMITIIEQNSQALREVASAVSTCKYKPTNGI